MSIETRAPGNYIADGEGRPLYTLVNVGEGAGGELEIAPPGAATGGAMTGGAGGGTVATLPCTGECAQAWPPLTVEGGADAVATEGLVDASLVGTTTREDGSTQVTYNGYPLYYFSGDEPGGRVAGQAVESFGGIWYVLNPETGDPLESDSEEATDDG